MRQTRPKMDYGCRLSAAAVALPVLWIFRGFWSLADVLSRVEYSACEIERTDFYFLRLTLNDRHGQSLELFQSQ